VSHVRDDHVGVEVRVLRPARAVLIGRRDEPRGVLAVDAVAAAPRHARLILEVAERGLPRRQMRFAHRTAGLLVAERVQQADALRRREDEVEPRDRRELLRLDPPLVGQRVDPLDRDHPRPGMRPQLVSAARVEAADQPAELAVVNVPFELELLRAAACPDAG
jgi:hypothetical protein